MKSIFTLFIALGSAAISHAQSIVATVKGTVTANKVAVESATVSLLKAKDSSTVKLGVTDKNGAFSIEKSAEGKFFVRISAVGYAPYSSEVFSLSRTNPIYTVKPIVLSVDAKGLKDVVVNSKKPMIEQKLDRTILNVEASPTNAGLTALEILEKAPGISVDKDGNISLKGKQGIMILLDGKPTYLSATDLTNMLRNMPGANLDVIEIMTNPPAKYDAAGNGGVINIKTKKTKTVGFNGSVTSGYGQGVYPKANNSFNINYRHNKVNYFANASNNYSEGFQNIEIKRNFRDLNNGAIVSMFDQLAASKRKYNSFSYKAGADYFLNKKTTLGVVVNGFGQSGTEDSDNTTYIKDNNGALVTRTEAINLINIDFKNIGANLNLRHVFDSTGKELTADIDYISYRSANEQYMDNIFFDHAGNKKGLDEKLQGHLPSDIAIYSAKVDYSQPMKGNAKFEAGIKASYVNTDNNALYENWDGATWVKDAGRSNHFKYREHINAGYINFSKPLNKKWSLQTGLRVENTIARGNQVTTNTKFNRDYTQVFPTAYLGYTHNAKNAFALSIGRRIERPDYEDMNPFFYFLDKYTYQVGNPYLRPQFTQNVELNHTYKGFLTTTLNYSKTTNIISDVLDQVDSITTTFATKSNIASQQNFGIAVSAGFPITKWWRTNIYTNAFHNRFEGLVNGAPMEANGSTIMSNMSNQFTFKNGWGAELSGFYRTSSIEGILVAKPMGAVNMAFSKQVLKKKGTLKLNIRDIFYIQQFRGYSRYQNIDVNIHNRRDSRVVNISFTYRFSKGKINNTQRKRGGAGEEQSRVKGGDGN
jgi:outer membrane receptor protein involved in Fe transport